jgi:hypothetical protein
MRHPSEGLSAFGLSGHDHANAMRSAAIAISTKTNAPIPISGVTISLVC